MMCVLGALTFDKGGGLQRLGEKRWINHEHYDGYPDLLVKIVIFFFEVISPLSSSCYSSFTTMTQFTMEFPNHSINEYQHLYTTVREPEVRQPGRRRGGSEDYE